MRERALGIKIPPTDLEADFDNLAHAFANELADRLGPSQQVGEGFFPRKRRLTDAIALAANRKSSTSAGRQ